MENFTPEQIDKIRKIARTLKDTGLAISEIEAQDKATDMVLTEIKQNRSEAEKKKGLFSMLIKKESLVKPKIDLIEPELPKIDTSSEELDEILKPRLTVNKADLSINPDQNIADDNRTVSEIMQDAGIEKEEITETESIVSDAESVSDENETIVNPAKNEKPDLKEDNLSVLKKELDDISYG